MDVFDALDMDANASIGSGSVSKSQDALQCYTKYIPFSVHLMYSFRCILGAKKKLNFLDVFCASLRIHA